MTDSNPFGASPAAVPADRSHDPIPPDADLPKPADTTPPAADTVANDDAASDRAEFEAWRDQRAADRAASTGGAQEGEAACPFCGASLANPAAHENLSYCWRCGHGAGAGQEYPVDQSKAATVAAKVATLVGATPDQATG